MTQTAGILELVGIADRGVVDKERVVCRTTTGGDLVGHLISVGLISPERPRDGFWPIKNLVFFLPPRIVGASEWVIIYTGKGESQRTVLPTGEVAWTFFWNSEDLYFLDKDYVPIIFHATSWAHGDPGPFHLPDRFHHPERKTVEPEALPAPSAATASAATLPATLPPPSPK